MFVSFSDEFDLMCAQRINNINSHFPRLGMSLTVSIGVRAASLTHVDLSSSNHSTINSK